MLCGGSLTVSQETLDDYNKKLDAAIAKAKPGSWARSGVNSYYKPKAPVQR